MEIEHTPVSYDSRSVSEVSSAEGARAKRRYVKRSKIWNTKGKGKTKENNACQGESGFSHIPNDVIQTPEPKTGKIRTRFQ